MKSMRYVLVIALGLIVIVGALYIGRRNQTDDESIEVPTGKPFDFSQQRCEEILYNPIFRGQQVLYPKTEVEPKPKDQVSYVISGTVGYTLWFSHKGYNYQKACPDQPNILNTNMEEWGIVKGQQYEDIIGTAVVAAGFDKPASGFSMSSSRHEQLFTLETELVMQDALDPDTKEHSAGLVFRVPAFANPERATGYGVALTTKGSTGQSGVKLFTYDAANTVIQFVPFNVNIGRLYQLKVAVSPAPDPRIKVWVDDNLTIDVADPDPNIVGYAGLMVGNEIAHFDHVYLTNQGSPLAASALNTNLPSTLGQTPTGRFVA